MPREVYTSRDRSQVEAQCKGSYELGTACGSCRRCCNELLTYKITIEERGLLETEKKYNQLLGMAKTINNVNQKLASHGMELSRTEKQLARFLEEIKNENKKKG